MLALAENSDDFYGTIGVRDVDVILRQLQVAQLQALALQAELDKIDVEIADDDFQDNEDPSIQIEEEEPEPLQLIPDITVIDNDVELSVDTAETVFKQEEVEAEVNTLIDPVLKTPFEPRTLMKEDVDLDFDPSRPDYGSIIGMTEGLRERISQYYYDRSNSYEMVFYLTPEEFLNLAATMPAYETDRETVDDLQEKIFPEDKPDFFAFDPLYLEYNVDDQRIVGHEGRHRSFAILQEQQKRGEGPIKIPVRIVFKKNSYNESWGMINRSERPDVVPIVPLELEEIQQELWQPSRVHEIAGPAPKVTSATTFDEYKVLTEEYFDRVTDAKAQYGQEQIAKQMENNKKVATVREMVETLLDEVSDVIRDNIDTVEVPRDIDYTDTIFEATYLPEDVKMLNDDNTVMLGDYYRYDIDKKQLFIDKSLGVGALKPSNMKLLMEAAGKNELPFEIITPEDEEQGIENRNEEYNLTVDEEDELMGDFVNMFNTVIEEATSSSNEYGGSIDTVIRNIRLKKQLRDMLEEE